MEIEVSRETKVKLLIANDWEQLWNDDNWIKTEWRDDPKVNIDWAGWNTDDAYAQLLRDMGTA